MASWVYLLRCSDGSYYVGHTDNLEKRVEEHQSGDFGGYTSKRRPVQLVHSQDFPTREEAFAAERQIKGWSRAKKEALIRTDWNELRRLARGRSRERAHPSTGLS
jgi:predicted GIY-YIG superfamily endonuclease